MVPKTQIGWPGRAGLALLLAAGISTAFCDTSSAQDHEPCRGERRREVCAGEKRPLFASGACHACNGGPYKGFYPCNYATPYCGGGCNVYGDAPVYSAPADFGSHCALWCR
ncbi:MAG TPA: hypothetical protein VMR25_24380 [Planctomycetaceae bacterium]|jgi:hypothetical protein|nr:hypothetical protein [Planctomycetaceae bacterium]